ncbi:hypothetical protein [Anabaena sp. CCY 0017]|uniref:hypothetical protein n=1 Tax=Anabaena sp. CCY 0017 TaxID=3103866 RepID=UPI0039C6D460
MFEALPRAWMHQGGRSHASQLSQISDRTSHDGVDVGVMPKVAAKRSLWESLRKH